MKILFYTRFETNTGGDEAFLNVLQFYMLKNLPEDTEVHLCISYDEASIGRAERVEQSWLKYLEEKNFKGQVWLFLTSEASLEKSIPGVREKYITVKKTGLNTLNTLDAAITWYIYESSTNTYFIYRNKEKKELKRKEKPELADELESHKSSSLTLNPKNCYFSLEKSANPTEYPLFILNKNNEKSNKNAQEETGTDITFFANVSKEKEEKDVTLSYYRNINDVSPEYFILGKSVPGKIQNIERILKTSKVALLPDSELKVITTFNAFIPQEVLLSEQEYQEIERIFILPEEVKSDREKWGRFHSLTSTLDAFVVAGWAHLQSPVTSRFLKTQFELPVQCKILLACVPGMSINACGFVTGFKQFTKYQNVHVLQPGLNGNGGFPMLPSLTFETVALPETRKKWLEHIGLEYQSYVDANGDERKDRLIVIYCSKDAPGLKGGDFLAKIEDNNLPVLLIGADDKSKAYEAWVKQCKARGFSCKALPRTEQTAVLMCGLRGAQHAMATGSYSILEAWSLGIKCAYLAPPHMWQLDEMLTRMSEEGIKQTFIAGEKAGYELSQYLLPKYDCTFFGKHHAWNNTDLSGFRNFIETAESQRLAPRSEVLSSSKEEIRMDTGNTGNSYTY